MHDGRCTMADAGRWPMHDARWPMHDARWLMHDARTMADARCMADARWPMHATCTPDTKFVGPEATAVAVVEMMIDD